MDATNHFIELAAVDVGNRIEKKGNLSYLSWAWAVDQLLRRDPAASWSYAEPVLFGETMMVICTVTAYGQARTMQLPVMDHRNKAIPNPDAFQVNTAMQRCLVKAIALHGLGLYIYAGEDVPADLPPESLTPEQETALQELRDAAFNGVESLKTAWKATGASNRQTFKAELAALKDAAAKCDAGVTDAT
ncbi:MAG TPA: DUF1071 domain-containing protein [Candidatus Bathyarchaeia archaeon]|nr:DUF1071 domain-containing protein [Candidatus Bathyarchaeia archaeon]